MCISPYSISYPPFLESGYFCLGYVIVEYYGYQEVTLHILYVIIPATTSFLPRSSRPWILALFCYWIREYKLRKAVLHCRTEKKSCYSLDNYELRRTALNKTNVTSSHSTIEFALNNVQ